MTTVLTREYLDVRPKGWEDYAAKRIAQLYGFGLIFSLWNSGLFVFISYDMSAFESRFICLPLFSWS